MHTKNKKPRNSHNLNENNSSFNVYFWENDVFGLYFFPRTLPLLNYQIPGRDFVHNQLHYR